MPAAGAALGAKALIGLVLGGIGAKTATDIYATKRAGTQNKRAMEATERSDVRAGEREDAAREEARRQAEALLARQQVEDARAEQARQDRLAFAREQWAGYLGAQQPHWRLGANVLGRLSDMAGGDLSAGGGDMRQYLAALPTSGGVAGGGPGPGTGSAVARQRPVADLSPTVTIPDRSRGLVFPQAAFPQASRTAPSLFDLMSLLAQGGDQPPRPSPLQTRGARGGLSLAEYYAATQAPPAL